MDQTNQIINSKPATASAQPDIQIPGYEILSELGHGGMAHVYLSIQESFGREVALKILSPHLADDEQFTKRFLREARIVSQLNHPNIITVYDAGKLDKYHYMSMEYIPGKDLKQIKDSISREETLRIVKDVAAALDYAGNKGIVHRDVKPENIMIEQSSNRVILMDFGIAHGDDVTQGMTQTGKAIGTPHFMSPEQTKGLKVDHRSDIYSLGVVLFQLLAGHLPFDADSAVAVGIKHLTAPIPLLPGGLEIFQPIINRCLSKQPQHRYQKAAELISALAGITDKQLESINTQTTVFKKAGADHDAETQISEVSVSKKRKVPGIVFPSNSKNISVEKNINTKEKNSRRNLLFILFLCSSAWFTDKNRAELINFWGYQVSPQLIEAYPNLIPESYKKLIAKQELVKQTRVSPATKVIQNAQNTTIKEKVVVTDSSLVSEKKPLSKEEQISIIKSELNEHPENAIKLATIYKEILLTTKQDPFARNGLKELRKWYIQQIRLAFASEDTALARQRIIQMKQSFPITTKNKQFIRLEKKVSFLEKINLHFAKAEEYFKSGALSKPLHKNALYEINNILKLSPKNEDANNFINKIVNSYIEKTEKLQEQGNTQNAILMVEEGIAALNSHPILINKRIQLKNKVKNSKKVTSLFIQAKKYQAADHLIKPQAYNAYDIYKKILEKEPGNLQAIAGLKSIHQQLAKKITETIKKGDLKISGEYLQASIKRYGRSSLLAGVQLKLNDALAEIAPKIETIKLSALEISSLITKNYNKKTILALKLKQTLYVGFNYINFEPQTTWLDATLVDVTNKIVVARKPIVISNQFGEHFFEVNLPTGSFNPHNYKIEIRLKNRVLVSKTFAVKK